MKPLFLKSLLLRFFLSFLILTTFVLIVVSVFIYLNYQRQILNESSDVSKKMLFQTKFAVEFIKDWIVTHLIQLYGDADLFSNMYGSEVSLIDEVETRQKMSQAIISNPLIYSIYLYNANTGKVYSSLSTPSDAATFYDQDIFSILSNPSGYLQLRFIPRKIDFTIYNTRHQENILTVIRTETTTKDQPLEGALILNLRADHLQQTMQSMYTDRQDDEFIILDAKGRILSHADPDKFLHDVSAEPYAAQVLASSDPWGVFTSMIAGKKYLVTYVSSDKLGWKFLRLTAYTSVLSKTYALRNLLITFCTVLFLVVLMLSLWLSRRLYSPIQALVSKVSAQMGTLAIVKERALMSELDYVSEAFLRVIHHTEDLQQQAQNHRTFVRQELLKKLLRGERHAYHDLSRTFQELELAIAPRHIQVVILRIDNYWQGFCQQLQPQNQILVKLALQDIMQKFMAMDYPSNEVIMMGDELFAVMLNVEEAALTQTESTLRRVIQRIQELAKKNFALTISSSIGRLAPSLAELPSVYQEAVALSQYTLVYGWESILSLQILSKHQAAAYKYPEKLEKHILDALRLRKTHQLEQHINNVNYFYTAFKKHSGFTPTQFRQKERQHL